MSWTAFSNRVSTRIFLYGVCPLLTFIFTLLIASQLYKQRKVRNTLGQGSQTNSKYNEFRISVMLFVIACMFLLSKIFQTTVWYLLVYSSKTSVHFERVSVASHYARILLVLNHSLNSLVCIIFMKSFRKAFVSIICCKWNVVGIEPAGNIPQWLESGKPWSTETVQRDLYKVMCFCLRHACPKQNTVLNVARQIVIVYICGRA